MGPKIENSYLAEVLGGSVKNILPMKCNAEPMGCCIFRHMARFFYKCLGRFALMTAAALWAGCNDDAGKSELVKNDSVKESPAKDFSSSSSLERERKESVDKFFEKNKEHIDKVLKTEENLHTTGMTTLYGSPVHRKSE